MTDQFVCIHSFIIFYSLDFRGTTSFTIATIIYIYIHIVVCFRKVATWNRNLDQQTNELYQFNSIHGYLLRICAEFHPPSDPRPPQTAVPMHYFAVLGNTKSINHKMPHAKRISTYSNTANGDAGIPRSVQLNVWRRPSSTSLNLIQVSPQQVLRQMGAGHCAYNGTDGGQQCRLPNEAPQTWHVGA